MDPSATTRKQADRIDARTLATAREHDTATLHEAAGKRGVLPPQIKPLAAHFRICGPASTVHSPGGDNLWLHRAIYAAAPGDVLVVYVSGAYEHGYWGEIMSTAAQVRHLGGLVIDGCVRDGALLREMPFPVFARGLCVRGTSKDFGARGWINHPLLIEGQAIHAGDLVVGDEDGVIVIERAAVERVLAAAEQRRESEREIVERLQRGDTTLGIYGLE